MHSGMKIKGNIIKARYEFVIKSFGEEAWQQVVSSLPEDNQAILRGIIVNSVWYPWEVNKNLDQAIVDLLGGGSTEVFEEMGRGSATENLSGVHQLMLEPNNPEAFMKKAQAIYSFYYNSGYRTYEATSPTSGILTTYDAETNSANDCLTVIGWYKQALEMCGATDVTMVEISCRATGGETCKYEVAWSGP